MMLRSLLLVAVGSCLSNAYSFNGVSVQLFEWSWADIAVECESFLGPKGFTAVQISPPMEHIQGSQWWTRYQPVSYTLISRSGNQTQLVDMINRCGKVGVKIIADAVINHMAAGSGVGIAGSSYGGRSYTIYSPNDFHHYDSTTSANCQVSDYSSKYNVQYCDLEGLPDLYTSSAYVRSTLAQYLNHLQSLGVAGIRVDAAKHQDASELAGILDLLPDNFYIGQEVIGAAGEAVQPSMYYDNGQVSEFYYSDYLCDNVVPENKMKYLQSFGESWGLMPEKYAAVFIDNHDTQRNGRAQLTYKNGNLYTFANIFMLAWSYGDVRLMSSYYFTNTDVGPPSIGPSDGKYCTDGTHWVCEHRWTAIANMVKWRNAVDGAAVSNWQTSSDNQIAFSRGGKGFIAMNRGSSTWNTSLQTGLSAGSYCNIISSSSCEVVVVSSSGFATVSVPALSAVALHINAKA